MPLYSNKESCTMIKTWLYHLQSLCFHALVTKCTGGAGAGLLSCSFMCCHTGVEGCWGGDTMVMEVVRGLRTWREWGHVPTNVVLSIHRIWSLSSSFQLTCKNSINMCYIYIYILARKLWLQSLIPYTFIGHLHMIDIMIDSGKESVNIDIT